MHIMIIHILISIFSFVVIIFIWHWPYHEFCNKNTVCYSVCVCVLNVGLHPHIVPPILSSQCWDQFNGDLSHKEASPHELFLFRKFSVSGQHFLLHMVCQFHGAQLFPTPLA